jgi:hypothetical protein
MNFLRRAVLAAITAGALSACLELNPGDDGNGGVSIPLIVVGTYEHSEQDTDNGVTVTNFFRLELHADSTFLLTAYRLDTLVAGTDVGLLAEVVYAQAGRVSQRLDTLFISNIMEREDGGEWGVPPEGSLDTLVLRNITATSFEVHDEGDNWSLFSILGSLNAVSIDTASLAPGHFSTQFGLTVMKHDPVKRTVVVAQEDLSCDSAGNLASEKTVDTSSYAIEGGTLYIWTDGECLADVVLDGSASTIVGTWTSSTLGDRHDSLPAKYRPAQCPAPDSSDGEDEGDGPSDSLLFDNISATYRISETGILVTFSGRLCFARALADMFTGFGDSIEVASSGCTSAQLVNTADTLTAALSSDFEGGIATLTFTHDTTTCVLENAIELPGTDRICSEGGDPFETFGECVGESGFFGMMGGGPMPKLSGGQSLAKRLMP